MHNTPDSTSHIAPPVSPLRVGSKPPEKKRRREKTSKQNPKKTEKTGDEGNTDRGKAVDVRI